MHGQPYPAVTFLSKIGRNYIGVLCCATRVYPAISFINTQTGEKQGQIPDPIRYMHRRAGRGIGNVPISMEIVIDLFPRECLCVFNTNVESHR